MAIAFVRQAVATQGSGTSLGATIVGAAAGNVLIATSTQNAGLLTAPPVCTNVTWTVVKAALFNNFAADVWYGVVAGGTSGTTVTFTYTGSTFACVNVSEWSGLKLASAIDTNSTANGSSTAPATGSATPSAGPALLVAVMAHNNTSGTVSAGPTGGFTALTQAIQAATFYNESAYLIQTSPAAANPGWTLSISGQWEATLGVVLGTADTVGKPPMNINQAVQRASAW